ncbi:MAG: ABC transporter permease [Succinivibrionaceae bacterium]|nr:ABC transporter permease [Succinivibrionaceae bacterium]
MSRAAEIARLSLKDVLHEWRMSLCVMLAVAAIATPLLLFFGLKSGVMETLKGRLLNNPATVEIISATERKLDTRWFEAQRADPRVAFVIPRTRRLAASAEFSLGRERHSLDILPSGEGDPLLLHYGLAAPREDGCVLSALAARRLGAKAGDTLTATITRDRGRSKVARKFTVSGILPDAAGTTACAYITLPGLEEIESYKDGLAVPSRGWGGGDSLAPPVALGVLVSLRRPLDAVREAMLTQNTGFATLARPAPAEYASLHPALDEGRVAYLVGTVGNPATADDVSALADRLRGKHGALLIPTAPGLSISVGGTELTARASAALGQPLYEGAPESSISAPRYSRSIYVGDASGLSPGPQRVRATYHKEQERGEPIHRELEFTAEIKYLAGVPAGTALLPPPLLSRLSGLASRELEDGLDSRGQPAFLWRRSGYTGFRMYAASLNDVVGLQSHLEAQGIRTVSRADRISEVLSLDHYLSVLFMLIASASLTGATCCLVASIYANVERKRRELAILRLIGVRGAELGIFPLTGSLAVSMGGMAMGLGAFYLLSVAVNQLFAGHLGKGESFCSLAPAHALAAVGIAAALSCLAGLIAARRVVRIDPALTLRDE